MERGYKSLLRGLAAEDIELHGLKARKRELTIHNHGVMPFNVAHKRFE